MRHKDPWDIPIGMQKVQRRLESWRQGRRGRERIPDALWAAAATVAREHGVNRTAKVLGLEFKKLKELARTPQFVEVVTGASVGDSECVIELEGKHGKMRIHWKGITASDVAQLSRLLLEQA